MATVDRSAVLKSWIAARWSAARLRTRADIEARQARLWARMTPVLARTPAVAHLAGQPLEAFPIVSPDEVRRDFEQWNTLGLTRAEAEAAARDAETGGAGEVRPGVSAGFSSGSSGGLRGLFLSSRAERAGYLGHLIARLLPRLALIRGAKIALCLRATSSLYSDVTGAGPFHFLFLGLETPGEERIKRLAAFAPDVVIAPSHVLADLARRVETGAPWTPRRLLQGAEPMGDAERDWIEAVLESRPTPIYQATEGFLASPCRLGTLHLNEDVLVVEREVVPGTNRFVPIITDLRRTTQPMVRVRLGDLLEPTTCICRSPLQAIRPVEGRLEDLWRWGEVAIPPRAVDDAVCEAIGAEAEWRAVAGPGGVTVEAAPDDVTAATDAVRELLRRRGLELPVTPDGMPPEIVVKRRRVRWIDG
ncbi:MAG: cell division protein FtsA [Brevundimonas sp.]|nr:cell division protein FtsA [Brevundimonas sp.]